MKPCSDPTPVCDTPVRSPLYAITFGYHIFTLCASTFTELASRTTWSWALSHILATAPCQESVSLPQPSQLLHTLIGG